MTGRVITDEGHIAWGQDSLLRQMLACGMEQGHGIEKKRGGRRHPEELVQSLVEPCRVVAPGREVVGAGRNAEGFEFVEKRLLHLAWHGVKPVLEHEFGDSPMPESDESSLGLALGLGLPPNINLQMNYWPADTTNLSETHQALFHLIRTYQPRGPDGTLMSRPTPSPENGFLYKNAEGKTVVGHSRRDALLMQLPPAPGSG